MIPGGMLAGRLVDLTFYDNGTARGTSGNIMLEVSWEEPQQGQIAISHINAHPAAAGCPAGQVGIYNFTFQGDCNTAVAQAVQDSCEHRRRTLDGLQGRRQ